MRPQCPLAPRARQEDPEMPTTPHIEQHFTAGDTVRDVVIGMSDGLTVPFALAAGLSGAVSTSGVIITAGLAEIAAGSIAMGLGGYLAARSDAEHYASERRREIQEIRDKPEVETEEVALVFRSLGLSEPHLAPVVEALKAKPDAWLEFMMRFELGLEKPNPRRALASAVTIAFAYIAGGLIPLSPYFAVSVSRLALVWSVGLTLLALLAFGYVKGKFTGARPFRSGIQTMLIGGVAAGAAFLIARMIAP
jgi:VIT1/CCC1 family predicted Fe2+/Mn2+ transporter